MTKMINMFILAVGILAIVGVCYIRFSPYSRPGRVETKITSTLTDAIDLSELSTAEFRYRGIANIFKDENKTQIKCRICYSAIVKAGVDLRKIDYVVDENNKEIIASLPDIDYTVTIVDQDSVALLPDNVNIELPELLKTSKEDVENEAMKSKELVSAARNNLKTSIEGLLYPILNTEGFSLMWQN